VTNGPLLNSTWKRTYPITGAAENKELIRNMFAESSRATRRPFSTRWPTTSDTRSSALNNFRHLQRETEFINKALTPAVAQLEGGITITPDNFIAEGDFVATQGRGNACTKSGGTYNNTYCHAFRIANRK
jgi:ketosteroid isomerase-like protein